MDRRFRSSIYLVLFLVSLVAFAVLVVRPEQTEKVKQFEADWNERFVFNDLKEKSLVMMEVISEEGLVTLELKDGAWWITKPIVERASQKEARLMAESYLKARWDRNDLTGTKTEFGLFPPLGRITGRTSEGVDTPPLLLGRTSPADASLVYAAIEGRPQVYLVDRQYRTAIVRYLNEMRTQNILDTLLDAPQRLHALEIFSDGRPNFSLLKKEDGWWIQSEAENFKADDVDVDRAFRMISENATSMSWPDETGLKEKEHNLDKPTLRVMWELSPPSPDQPFQRYEMKIGRIPGDIPERDKFYMKCDWLMPISQVSDYMLKSLDLQPDKLRDRRLLPLDPATIVRISLVNRDGSKTEAALSKDRWLLSPGSRPASALKVTKFLEELVGFRALLLELAARKDPDRPENPRLLNNIVQSATLVDAEGREHVFRIGEEIGNGLHWSTTSADPLRHYLVNRDSITNWPKKTDDWLSLDAK